VYDAVTQTETTAELWIGLIKKYSKTVLSNSYIGLYGLRQRSVLTTWHDYCAKFSDCMNIGIMLEHEGSHGNDEP